MKNDVSHDSTDDRVSLLQVHFLAVEPQHQIDVVVRRDRLHRSSDPPIAVVLDFGLGVAKFVVLVSCFQS